MPTPGGAAELRAHAPFHTCEAVLGELAFLLGTGVPGLQLVVQGDLILDFDLGAEAQAVLGLLQKYRDRQMDLADAGLLRRPELEPRCQVWTVDRGDFRIDRRHGRQPVPCEVPPEQR